MIEIIVALGVLGLYVAIAIAISAKRNEKVPLEQVREIVQRKSKLGRDRFEGITSSLKTAPALPVQADEPGCVPSVEKLAPQKHRSRSILH